MRFRLGKRREQQDDDVAVVPAPVLVDLTEIPVPANRPQGDPVSGETGSRRATDANRVQLIFADGTVESVLPGHELRDRMTELAERMLRSDA